MERAKRTGPVDWDERFAGDEYLFGTAPNGFLVSCAALWTRGQRVLAVADGEGRNSTWLAEQGLVVDAFDSSSVAIAKARRLAAERGVTVHHQLADVDGFSWPDADYDIVAAIFVQFAPPDLRRRMFDRIASTLRPGGVLLLEGYRIEQLEYGTGGPRDIANLYSETQLRVELATLEIESLRAYDAPLDEGGGHAGMSALVDVIARRRP